MPLGKAAFGLTGCIVGRKRQKLLFVSVTTWWQKNSNCVCGSRWTCMDVCVHKCAQGLGFFKHQLQVSSMSHTWKPKRLNRKTSQTQKSLENWVDDMVSLRITA